MLAIENKNDGLIELLKSNGATVPEPAPVAAAVEPVVVAPEKPPAEKPAEPDPQPAGGPKKEGGCCVIA